MRKTNQMMFLKQNESKPRLASDFFAGASRLGHILLSSWWKCMYSFFLPEKPLMPWVCLKTGAYEYTVPLNRDCSRKIATDERMLIIGGAFALNLQAPNN